MSIKPLKEELKQKFQRLEVIEFDGPLYGADAVQILLEDQRLRIEVRVFEGVLSHDVITRKLINDRAAIKWLIIGVPIVKSILCSNGITHAQIGDSFTQKDLLTLEEALLFDVVETI